MIFVCTGTQVYQFDRLLSKIDQLIENGEIVEDVFAQTGASTYQPVHYQYKNFISADEFALLQDKADLIISHGGTGALISASKKEKNIIAVPRLAEFGEHTDDHQLQIVEILEKEGYVRAVYNMEYLGKTICEALKSPIKKPYDRESHVCEIILDYIDNLDKSQKFKKTHSFS